MRDRLLRGDHAGVKKKIEVQAEIAALSSCVATEDQVPGIFDNSHLSFAFAYLAGHFGLGLLTH
jgi:hypothetical protein